MHMTEVLVILNFLVLAGIIVLIFRSARRDSGIGSKFEQLEKSQARIEHSVKDEIARNRDEMSQRARESREEISSVLDKMRETVQERLKSIQDENSGKLNEMRAIVEEKLHSTLEKRLGESFNQVRQQLESVHKGLGEMQSLASSVGDLKKVLTNVKTRGTWGEIQLGTLLEQILAPGQYAENVTTKPGSNEHVEFAIRLPGKESDQSRPMWLPIDAKFPQEDYQRLLDAQEQAQLELVEKMRRQLEARIKSEAKDIKEKYIYPPNTTAFGIMFLPIEGLYAEVLRIPGLAESLQRDYQVTVAGPTTLAALLNSLQMGFRTLAIEKHSSQVWQLLGAVKAEFDKFGIMLDKTKKKLQEATNTIEDASTKTRTIQKKLKRVERLPVQREGSSIVDSVPVIKENT